MCCTTLGKGCIIHTFINGNSPKLYNDRNTFYNSKLFTYLSNLTVIDDVVNQYEGLRYVILL